MNYTIKTIELNEAERRLSRFLSKKRLERNRNLHGLKNTSKQGPQSDEDMELDGVAAEIAFCKAFNLYPDMMLDCSPIEDCRLPDGKTVDVKATVYSNGDLPAPKWKFHKQTDLYALMVGRFPVFTFKGFATKEMMFGKEPQDYYGNGDCYMVPQCELVFMI
jgi:hypothetical protein